MPATSHRSPDPRRGWILLCLLLVPAVVASAVLVLPVVVDELRPAAQWRAARAERESAAPGAETATESPGRGTVPGRATGAGDVTVDPTAAVTPQGLRRALESGLRDAPGTAAAAVGVAGEERVAAGENQDRPVTPASNQKLLTALGVAEHVGPYERLRTTVVAGEDPRRLTLVAGGDTMLAPGEGDPDAVNGHAGLRTLARLTARKLQQRESNGVSGSVRVTVDTSLFTGPDLNPAWQEEDVAAGEITRVAPVALYSHRVPDADGAAPGDGGERPEDPAAAALEAFSQGLQEELGPGARVRAEGERSAPQGAEELAHVESAPVHEQSAHMLAHSDNSLAETLARVAATRAGREASVAGVRELLPAVLREHGIDTTGLRVLDASGMAAGDRVTATTLVQTTNTLLTQPRFGPYGRGLPVAGGGGTLAERFDDPPEQAARGVSRAKTGTLLDVVALTGHVQREDGEVLVYSVVLNGVRGSTDRAGDSVDRTVAELARST